MLRRLSRRDRRPRQLQQAGPCRLGIPTEREFVDAYCRYSGREEIENFHYYVVHSLFRSAAIIQGVYKRGLDGNAASSEALGFSGMARERAETAWRVVEEHF